MTAAETWEARAPMWDRMTDEERRAYVTAFHHTFADVFTVIGEVLATKSDGLHEMLAQLIARRDEMTAAFTEAGVMQ
jgi:hypothetical protein